MHVNTCSYMHTTTEIIRLMAVHRAIPPCQFHEYHKNDSLPVFQFFIILNSLSCIEIERIGWRVSHKQLQRTV